MTNGRALDRVSSYEITVLGVIDHTWSDWFDGFTIHNQEGCTTLCGFVEDQSALLGILTKIVGLGITLMKVERQLDEAA